MGLRSTIDKAVSAAFKAIGDLPKNVTYNSVVAGSYDPATGTASTTTTAYTVQAILESYKAIEIDGQAIKPTDQKAMIQQSKLSATPKLTDTVIIDAVTWTVVNIGQDLAGATWVLQLRMA